MTGQKNNFNSQGTGALGITLVVITVIVLFFTTNFHIPNSGQHTGYVSAVEQSGLIWKTWTAYIKTDPQSSQEDTYCVTDPAVVNQLKSASENKTSVTINYSVPAMVWKWQCGGEQSTIQSIDTPSSFTPIPLSTTNSSLSVTTDSGTVNQEVEALSNDPDRYGVTVTQTGGIGSQTISIKAMRWDMEASAQYCSGYLWSGGFCWHYLKPTENYVSTSFSSPGGDKFGGEPDWVSSGYSMNVACKNGYKITNANSSTNNPLDTYFEGIQNMEVGMEILDQTSNSIYIVCTK